VFYVIQNESFLHFADRFSYGTKMPRVSFNDLAKYKCQVPKEKKEQEKIARILSTLDRAIESTNRLIEKEKNIKIALMQELLTNGIDKNGQIRTKATHAYKQRELGLLPDEWEVQPFSKVSSINMGQSPESEYVNENQIGIPFLQGNAEFGEKYPAEIYWTPQPKKLSKENDILISVRAPVGDINISDKEYCIGRGLASLTIKNLDPDFGYYALIQERYQLDRLAQGSTFLAIGKNDFDKLIIKIPTSKNEQKQIAKILTTQDKKIEAEETNLAKLKELKKGLMNDLLSGKERVEI
jgi:type I restriction enzyme, S subunit